MNCKESLEVIIIGAGIGGLTVGLTLHQRGIRCRVFEATSEIRSIGAGINLLPHATGELHALGLENKLADAGVVTKEARFFNRFGQEVYQEPLGWYAGTERPQISIHRGDLQRILVDAYKTRVGADRLHTGWRFVNADQDTRCAIAHFEGERGQTLQPHRGRAIVSCEGIHSRLRRQLYPAEGDPIYSGCNMWRGVVPWEPFLSGASMTRIGWLSTGKLVVYPIRDNIDSRGRQLTNWVAELETPQYRKRDWGQPGNLDDFLPAFESWRFSWLDVPALIRATETVLEYPMVDQEPLERWSFGRLTLLGDAAHPMYPRGSNGAGQAILDARSFADALATHDNTVAALRAYEAERIKATAQVVRANRENPPDAVLREVWRRTGDRPFKHLDDVISHEELQAMQDRYRKVTGL